MHGREHGFGCLTMGEFARVDTDGGGFAVERLSRAVEFLDRPPGIGGLQERSLAVLDPLVQMLGAGIQPDHRPDLRKQFAIFLAHDDASAGGDDQADAADESLQDTAFEGAKMLLTLGAENFRDASSRFLRHKRVGIDQGEAGQGREDASDAGFAGSHEPDEHEVAKHR